MFVTSCLQVIFENQDATPVSFTIGNEILHAEFSENGEQLLSGFGNTIQVVDISAEKVQSKFTTNGNINDIKFAGNDRILALTNKNVLCVHQGTSDHKDISLPDEGTSLAVVNNQALVGTKKGSFLVVDLASGNITHQAQVSSSKLAKIVVGNQKNLVAIGSSNGLLSFFNLTEGKLVSNDLKYHTMPLTSIQFSEDDSRCLTGGHERDVHYWDTSKFKHVEKFERKRG